MKRFSFVFVAIFALLMSPLPTLASNSIRVGSKCTKVNKQVEVRNTALICTRNVKGLYWKKLKSIVNDQELTKEIIWATNQSGVFPIERFTFPIPKLRATSWSDVLANSAGISYQAWDQVSRTIKSSRAKNGTVIRFVGPNSNPPFQNLELPMELISKAFPKSNEVKTTRFFIYSYEDLDWAINTYEEEFKNESGNFQLFQKKSVQENCDKIRKVCWAMGFVDSNFDGVILLGVLEPRSEIKLNQTYDEYSRSDLGLTIAHEYFHTVQRKVLGDSWYNMNFTPPTWFIEGSATFAENAVMNHDSWHKYMQYSIASSKLALPSCNIPANGCIDVTEEILNDFMQLKHYPTNWSNFPYAFKYEVSARIIEILVALQGTHSLIELMSLMAEKNTFDKAFEIVYGISYLEAIPIISKVVASQFAN